MKMCVALHVPFGTLAMVYILVKMCLALHIPFGTLAMAYILIKMCLTFHVPFKTLDMAYIPFEMCLALVIVNISSKCTLPIITSLMFLLKHRPKIYYAF
jgi:hypothetical protein